MFQNKKKSPFTIASHSVASSPPLKVSKKNKTENLKRDIGRKKKKVHKIIIKLK